MKTVFAVILGLLLIVGLGWLFTENELLMNKYFAPKQEAVRRNVFEQSKAYNQGMIQELENMRFDYVKAKPEQQAALRSIILHRAADYPLDSLPYDTRIFIEGLKK